MDPVYRDIYLKIGRIAGKLSKFIYMLISSRALEKTKEGSETRDTKVSPQHPIPRTGNDIVWSAW